MIFIGGCNARAKYKEKNKTLREMVGIYNTDHSNVFSIPQATNQKGEARNRLKSKIALLSRQSENK